MTAPASPEPLARRVFGMEDQQGFARLSGDANPIHVDPVAARRTVVGAVVVHGVHTALWALEALAVARPELAARARGLEARFPKPLYPGEAAAVFLTEISQTQAKLSVRAGEKTVAAVTLPLDAGPCTPVAEDADLPLMPAGTPADVDFTAMKGMTGTVDVAASPDDFDAAFPHAAAIYGAARLRGIAACSRLVGMVCPGLRSVFSRLALEWSDEGAARVSYAVTETDERFNLVRMTVGGAGLSGRIEAFSPPPPAAPLSMAALKQLVGQGTFTGQRALVIGGSRGLGALTARLLAAGGAAEVVVTYAVGREEAEAVADDIRAAGGHARAMRYDATQAAAAQLAELKGNLPTHLYYFASGRIARAKAADFEEELFADFQSIYVQGFKDICGALHGMGAGEMKVFYPSSVFVESKPPDMAEYVKAKAEGESLCAVVPLLFPGLSVVMERLPRLPTEQNAAIAPQELPDAVEVLLLLLMRMK